MPEVEIGGATIRGGKLLLVLPLVGSLIGALWGGFEFYKDYMDMKEKIQTYVAPDLSTFDKRIAIIESRLDEEISLFKEEMQILKDEVKLIAGVNRDMKVDMKTDIRRIEKIVEDTETRVKEDSREFSRDMKELKIDLDKKIKRALENPLTNMNRQEIVKKWIKDRVKEMSTWSGASLIAFGLLIVLGGPFVELVAYAAIVWGVISILKKD